MALLDKAPEKKPVELNTVFRVAKDPYSDTVQLLADTYDQHGNVVNTGWVVAEISKKGLRRVGYIDSNVGFATNHVGQICDI